MVTADEVRRFSLKLPQVEEIGHWGKPSFRIKNKIFAVIQEDEITMIVKTTPDDRSAYTTMDPEVYQVPANYSNLNYMIVRLDRVDQEELNSLLLQAWRLVAPKRLSADYQEMSNSK